MEETVCSRVSDRFLLFSTFWKTFTDRSPKLISKIEKRIFWKMPHFFKSWKRKKSFPLEIWYSEKNKLFFGLFPTFWRKKDFQIFRFFLFFDIFPKFFRRKSVFCLETLFIHEVNNIVCRHAKTRRTLKNIPPGVLPDFCENVIEEYWKQRR